MSNRAARRAKPAKVPMVRLGLLTVPEAELMAEWADAWLLSLVDVLPANELEWTDVQRWAKARTVQLREMLQAAAENRPALDEHAQREEPT